MAMFHQLTEDLRLEVELRFTPTMDGVAYSVGLYKVKLSFQFPAHPDG